MKKTVSLLLALLLTTGMAAISACGPVDPDTSTPGTSQSAEDSTSDAPALQSRRMKRKSWRSGKRRSRRRRSVRVIPSTFPASKWWARTAPSPISPCP